VDPPGAQRRNRPPLEGLPDHLVRTGREIAGAVCPAFVVAAPINIVSATGANRFGFGLRVRQSRAGRFVWATGTWTVTAA
jgi:hypothetical protein